MNEAERKAKVDEQLERPLDEMTPDAAYSAGVPDLIDVVRSTPSVAEVRAGVSVRNGVTGDVETPTQSQKEMVEGLSGTKVKEPVYSTESLEVERLQERLKIADIRADHFKARWEAALKGKHSAEDALAEVIQENKRMVEYFDGFTDGVKAVYEDQMEQMAMELARSRAGDIAKTVGDAFKEASNAPTD